MPEPIIKKPEIWKISYKGKEMGYVDVANGSRHYNSAEDLVTLLRAQEESINYIGPNGEMWEVNPLNHRRVIAERFL